MKIKLSNLFILAFAISTFIIPFSAKASYQLGVDMSYQCTATPNVYLVKVKIYRDCSGTQQCANCPSSMTPCAQINLNIIGGGTPCNGTNFGTTALSLVTAQSGYDVVQLCGSTQTTCTNCGTRTAGTFSPGIEVYTYEGNVSFVTIAANQPTCCLVKLGYTGNNRNPNVTTVTNPGNVGYYTELLINRCASPCNSSPVYNNPTEFVVCNGVDQTLNVGAVDPDGDSLSYALATAYANINLTSVPYISPNNAIAPFPFLGAPSQSPPAVQPAGIKVNNLTGDIQFRPNATFVAPIAIEIKQWKKVGTTNSLVGTTRRDYTIYSQNCPANTSVQLKKYDSSGVSLGTYSYSGDSVRICPGARFCSVFAAADSSVADTTDLSWSTNSNMVGASFNALYNTANRGTAGPRQDSFMFCWTAPLTAGSLTPYIFNIIGKDRFCSLPAKVLRSVAIYVNILPTATINKTIVSKSSVKFSYTKTNTITTNTTQTQWKIETAPGSNVFTTYNSDTLAPLVFSQSGNYKVKLLLSTTNCGLITFSDSAVIRFVNINLVAKSNLHCKADSSGAATLSSNGGANPVSYKLNGGIYQNSGVFEKLLAGIYLATVIDSFGTTDTVRFSITEPPTAIGLSSSNIVNLKCKGDSIGQATLTVSNGTVPFQYKISGMGFQSSNVFTNLKGGNNLLVVADSNNCTASINVNITEPANKLNGSLSTTNPLCNGQKGSASISASGGNTPYQYKMDAGSYNLTNTFSNLDPKTYVFYIKDWNGCELSFNSTITEPTLLVVNAVKNNISCYGLSDGKVTLNASGAIPPYQYKKGTGAYGSNNIFSSLSVGGYLFTIKDSNACTITSNVSISQPLAPLTKTFSYTNSSCLGSNNGTASIAVSGGVLPYSYNWNTTPPKSTPSVTNLPPGLVKVVVTDSNLCSVSDSATITFKPLFNGEQLCIVTVDTATGKNTIIWNKTGAVGIAAYKILAASSLVGPLTVVDSQAYNNMSIFTDIVSAPLKQAYYYQLKAIDSCGNESTASSTHGSIYAKVIALTANKNSLTWNTFTGNTSATALNILRSNNHGPFINVKQLPITATSYIDSLLPSGIMRYIIEAELGSNCNPTLNKSTVYHLYSNLMDMGAAGIFEAEKNSRAFEVYPNPSSGWIKVVALNTNMQIESIEIVNMMGTLVQHLQVKNQETGIDMSELTDGVYQLLIKNASGITYPVKVVLNRSN